MSDEQEMVLVCSPWDWPHWVPGVELEAGCGHRVQVSKAGMTQLLGSPGMQIMCVPCAAAHARANPGPHSPQAVPGVLAEIEAAQGAEERRDAERWAREHGWKTLG